MDEKRGILSKRERERERDEESMRIGEGRKSPGKTDVPNLHAYNECEHPVYCMFSYFVKRHTVDNGEVYWYSKHL